MIVQVLVAPSRVELESNVGRVRVYDGLIDTGADCTAIRPTVVRDVGLTKYKMGWIRRVGGNIQTRAFKCQLAVGGDRDAPQAADDAVELYGYVANIPTPGVDLLIGRDFLAHMSFHYDGRRGVCLLLH